MILSLHKRLRSPIFFPILICRVIPRRKKYILAQIFLSPAQHTDNLKSFPICCCVGAVDMLALQSWCVEALLVIRLLPPPGSQIQNGFYGIHPLLMLMKPNDYCSYHKKNLKCKYSSQTAKEFGIILIVSTYIYLLL